jgi:hypothetical protein
MPSEIADQALSPAATSYFIRGRTWKLGDPIYSTGVEAIKRKEMFQTFGDAFDTARAEGVFMGHGSGLKYRVKWTNLTEELILEYGANHRIFQDPCKERPSKAQKNHGPKPLSRDAQGSISAVPNMADAVELYPSSAEDSEPEDAVPQIPAISPLQIGNNLWRTDPSLDLQDPRFGLMIADHKPRLRFPQYFPPGNEPSELECVELFMHDDLISHLLIHTNALIANEKEQISEKEMKKWIGIMFAMTLSPISIIEDYWKDKDDGFIPSHSFGIKTGLGQRRFKFIRKHFAMGAVGSGSKTFDAFRPIQTFFNDRTADCFTPGQHVVIDESTCGWHGKDEKRADGLPAMTHMNGKPKPVSFMFKTLCCAETGIMIAMELQEGKDVMASRAYSCEGEKSSTSVTLRLTDFLPGPGYIVTGDSWFASLNTLQKLKERGQYFMGMVKTAHSGIPIQHLRGSFSQQSARGDTITLHLGAGHDRVFVHAWNEPGWRNGKAPKKPAKVFIANCFSAAPVATWRKERTYLLPDGMVERRYIDIPQTQVIREYFRTTNNVDIHNQYRQGILATERTWRTKRWNLRLFQTVMGNILVNGFLAFKFKTGKSPSLRDFTNVVAQAMCAGEGEEADEESDGKTRAEKQSRIAEIAVAPPSKRIKHALVSKGIKHALVKGTSLGVGGKRKQGPCSVCKDRHATGVCVTCSKGLDTDSPKPFWLCSTGPHGRQCYCQHLHEMLST